MTVLPFPRTPQRADSFVVLQSKELLGFLDDWRPRFWLEDWDGVVDSETLVIWTRDTYEGALAEALAIVADGITSLIDTVADAEVQP